MIVFGTVVVVVVDVSVGVRVALVDDAGVVGAVPVVAVVGVVAVVAGAEIDVVVVPVDVVLAGAGFLVPGRWRAPRPPPLRAYHGVGARRCEPLSAVSTAVVDAAGPELAAVRVSAGRALAGDVLGEPDDEQAVTNAAAAPRLAART